MSGKNIDEVEDIESVNMYHERLAEGYDKDKLIHAINVKGRDNARRPMQWNDEKMPALLSQSHG